MGKIALIIIYNHQFNKNIERLEEIYLPRFSSIFHLVPFYKGVKDNVIAVYENSYYFQGYVAQGLHSFLSPDFSHYLFVGDDLILNPQLNEENCFEILKLGPKTCFIPSIFSLHRTKIHWIGTQRAYYWGIEQAGVEAQNQIPHPNDARRKLEGHGFECSSLSFNQIWEMPSSPRDWACKFSADPRFVLRYLKSKVFTKSFETSYPLVGGYSDIFAISSDAIKEFSHYCGVFAATRLFVEVALPTSLLLAAERVVTEADLSLKGRALWGVELRELEKYGNSLKCLFSEFPEDQLYYHPVKLSKWS